MTALPPIPESTLSSHAAGLRGLARGLLRDEHASEDVVQETWLLALERPPANRARLGGWLRQVTRTLAFRRQRGDRRRQQRERDAAQSEALDSAEESASQREIVTALVNAVQSLSEPYRTVISMRYYQDLPPRVIARKRGVPVATVDSQLHRARQQLRARLDAETGGRRGAWIPVLAAATGWTKEAAAAVAAGTSVAAGGTTMIWKWLASAAVVSGAVVVGVQTTSEKDPSQDHRSLAAVVETGSSGSLDLAPVEQEESEGPTRRLLESTGRSHSAKLAPAAFRLPYEYEISGVIVDEWDKPINGAHLFLAPLQQPLNDWGECDREGRFHVKFRASTPSLAMAVAVAKGAPTQELTRISVSAGKPLELRLLLPGRSVVATGSEVEVDSSASESFELSKNVELSRRPLRRLVETDAEIEVSYGISTFVRESEPRISMLHGESGEQEFRWPAPPMSVEIEEENGWVGVLTRRDVSLNEIVELRAEADLEFEEVRGDRRGTIAGQVLDPSGQPVPGALIYSVGGDWEVQVGADREGRFRVALPVGADVQLRAGGGDHGIAWNRGVTIAEGEALSWNPQLDRGMEILGKLLTWERSADEDLVLEARTQSSHGVWFDWSRHQDANPKGFAFPNSPTGSSTLMVRRSDAAFPEWVYDGLAPGQAARSFRLEPRALGSALLQVVDDQGRAYPHAKVQLWHEASGKARWMTSRNDGYRMEKLPAGAYSASVHSPQLGWRSLGRVYVESGQETDLGSATLPGTGQVHWAVADSGPVEFLIRSTSSPVAPRVAEGVFQETHTQDLFPGSYLLWIQGEDFVSRAIPFDVEAGRATNLELALSEWREVAFVSQQGRDMSGESDALILKVFEGENGPVQLQSAWNGESLRVRLPDGSYRWSISALGSGRAAKQSPAEGRFEVRGEALTVAPTLP